MTDRIPKHIAIIMDGNGRWASLRSVPRFMGHRAGVDSARAIVEACIKRPEIEVLTLFAFSSENWKRPKEEINYLMDLFYSALKEEIAQLHANQVKLKIIGDVTRLPEKIQSLVVELENMTRQNTGLKLVIAFNYGGRWDITQAMKKLGQQIQQGELEPTQIDERMITNALSLADYPEPDLFIRTSGELRLSNFLLWDLAYTELFFSPVLWPDFRVTAFEEALTHYADRDRRYGG